MARWNKSSPIFQSLVVGFVLFACPGLYGAITGLGAGGGKPSSAVVGNVTNCALYGVYTFSAFFAGSVLNVFGPRWTLALGALTYPLYASGLWIYDRTGYQAPPITFGAVLGIGAGFLWTTAGFVQYSYADEKHKGKYIVLQWIMVAAGSFIGAAIEFGVNFHKTESDTGSPTSVYLIFIIIELVSIVFGIFFVIHPKDLVRKDGTGIAVFKPRGFAEEAQAYLKLLWDWKIWMLYIVGLSAEMCLSFQSTMSAHVFNLRTRSLVNLCFWAVQIPATLALQPIFDADMPRRRRAYIAATYVAVITLAIWIDETIWLTGPNKISVNDDALNLDWTDDSALVGPLFSGYVLSGVIYAIWQSVVQFVISTLSNDPKICARYAGMFKSSISLGMTVSFGVTAAEVEFLPQLKWQFSQQMISLVFLFVVCYFVTETNYYREDDVIVPTYVNEILHGRVDLERLQHEAAAHHGEIVDEDSKVEGSVHKMPVE
ncbi:uncharacterized protein STEHIDRAFT_136133 [Stereum hirsutum FP-91666 SS1]|uniref:uncharacterized protein n=1 Tax=Stereum hirsutum (strain FP-91666) TaxID=721885 RepID=UPI000440A50E|nr:uncharacterized protein STEHIDRAFT_136133 [Stereum hirsutum FP-91666 SS1]EIM92124.1 hypothetical protein STEHIDRAFT_136133 [Stereum hirsutum FP-91666 SS1]